MNKFIKKNCLGTTIITFLIILGIILHMKPNFLYTNYGSFRRFGLGKRNGTILPIWLLVIIIAICSYLIVLSYCKNIPLFK